MISVLRKVSALLSYFYKNDMSNVILKNKDVTKFIKKKLKKFSYINLKQTHKNFNDLTFKLLKKGDLHNFLRYSFIQKMFFVHNRIFIYKELIELKSSSQWKFYKNLLIEDNVGNPIRYFFYPKSSGNQINHVYHLSILNKFFKLDLKKINYVFEFGGGYGCMARIFSKINMKIKYCIFDTKIVNFLQYYYLKQNNLNVGFRRINQFILINKFTNLDHKLKKNSLFIANWSLSETPLNYRKKIIKIMKNYQYILISFQEYFEDIDNKNYFKKLKVKYQNKFKINIILNQNYKGNIFKKQNHYFFIAKKL